MDILLIGNCQVWGLAESLKALLPKGSTVRSVLASRWAEVTEETRGSLLAVDYVFYHKSNMTSDALARMSAQSKARLVPVPRVIFRGFHPDMVYLRANARELNTSFGPYHSAIAYAGFRMGVGATELMPAYGGELFHRLGYDEIYRASKEELFAEGDACQINLRPAFEKWRASGCFMYTFNHPKVHVLADIARLMLDTIGHPSTAGAVEGLLRDDLVLRPIWQVYPDLAQQLDIPGGFGFKRGTVDQKSDASGFIGNLGDFLSESMSLYETLGETTLRALPPIDHEAHRAAIAACLPRVAERSVAAGSPGARSAGAKAEGNPYLGLPSHQFWKRSVSKVDPAEVDPVVQGTFRLSRHSRIASAGSCFAQHIARALRTSGYTYFVSEPAPADMTAEEAARLNYGVFSARYANIYTARQLRQLFERAFGTFHPMDDIWQDAQGRYLDAFRPQIDPAGYPTRRDVEDSRRAHLAAVRQLFSEMDVFIFTLGLTEGWRSSADGAVYPLAPGVCGCAMDGSRYEFVNFSAREVEEDLLSFLSQLRTVNPHVRIILTVSPVPLVATFENRSVICSTAYSKAALRVAAENICRADPSVTYFPSYEIITGPFSRGAYFEEDSRSVTAEGVAHVMKLFLKHYGSLTEGDALPAAGGRSQPGTLFDVICEEEALDADRG